MEQWKGKLIDEIFGEKCEGQLIQYIYYRLSNRNVPAAKNMRSKGWLEGLSYCNGKEILLFPNLMIRLTKEKDLKNNWS